MMGQSYRQVTIWAVLLATLSIGLGCSKDKEDDNPFSSGSSSSSSSVASLRIVNNIQLIDGPHAIYFVFISPNASSQWGADRLGASDIIPFGSDRRFEIVPGTYDIKVIDDAGNRFYLINRRISGAVSWTVWEQFLDNDLEGGR